MSASIESSSKDTNLAQKPLEAQEKAARDLQWPQLLERIATHARTAAGVAALMQLRPLATQAQATTEQQFAEEALLLKARGAHFPVDDFQPLREMQTVLEQNGVASAEQLRDVGQLIAIAGRLRRHLSEHKDNCPRLQRRLWTSPELDPLGQKLAQAIDPSAEILDGASPELAQARRALSKERQRLKGRINQLLKKYSRVLSGQYFAEREGRCVLPMRADASERISGIVFGSSGSGGTLYVEPNELTEANNAIRVVEAQVAREEARVLLALSDATRLLLPELCEAELVCLKADTIHAVASWADRARARPVSFAETPELLLKQMRHPLLMNAPEPVVPNDIVLKERSGLILSGPNAGGKTVALKCLGLAVWMSRAGLPVPCAEGSEIGWFESVLTDIGDDQSLSRSLSTFSAHIRNIAHYLEVAGSGVLVLLDEVAGGTDPDEGAALACAILEELVNRGAAVATTTHYEKLKQLGAQPDKPFTNGSVGFDLQAMKPTFTVTMGTPGASSALIVAARYGIPPQVVSGARSLIPEDQEQQQAVLVELEQERLRLKRAREQTETALTEQERLNTQLASEKKRAYERERSRLQKEARNLTLEVQRARGLLEQAKQQVEKSAHDPGKVKRAEQLVSAAAHPVTIEGSVTQALQQHQGQVGDEISPALKAAELRVGQTVHIPHLNTSGELLALPTKGQAKVSVGGLKMTVPVGKLHRGRPTQTSRSPRARRKPQSSHVSAVVTPMRMESNTCDLRGERVEAGLEKVDEFIDRMLQGDETAGYVLHGHGTGAMKIAVREHLKNSPYIARAEPASRQDGGDALTIVWLR